jgi:hypothetical protein
MVKMTWQASGQAPFCPGVAKSRYEQSQCMVSPSSLSWQSRSVLSYGVKYFHSYFPTALIFSLYEFWNLSPLVYTYLYDPCFFIRHVRLPNLLQVPQGEACGIAVGRKVREVFDRLLDKAGVKDNFVLRSWLVVLICVERNGGSVEMQVLDPGVLACTYCSMNTEQLIVVSQPLSVSHDT